MKKNDKKLENMVLEDNQITELSDNDMDNIVGGEKNMDLNIIDLPSSNKQTDMTNVGPIHQ